MRFQVPQFIDVEDKIFGPFTFKQFLYLIGGAGVVALAYRLFGLWGIILASPFIALSLALTFYKINGKPFIFFLESAVKYYTRNRLYLWKKTERPITSSVKNDEEGNSLLYVPKLSQNTLKDITWNLDTKEGAGPGAAETMRRSSRNPQNQQNKRP